jgi:hypothetical protein
MDEAESKLRAIECSRSGLNDRGIMQLLGHLERQNATLECIDISDNPGRIHLERFHISMSRFAKIRKLDLSRVTRTSGDQPLIAPEVLLSWKLEELIMNGIPVSNSKALPQKSTKLSYRLMIKLLTPSQHIWQVICQIVSDFCRWTNANLMASMLLF